MKLYSRNNSVSLENGKVIKRFSNIHSFRHELESVTRLKSSGVYVPDILRAYGKTIEYKLIKGCTYQSLVDCFEKKHADALLKWLNSYYAALGTLRGDVNLRNFIYCKDKDICVGVDFEEVCFPGETESDFGRIIAFAVTYDPPFSIEKEDCARLLYECFKDSGADETKMHKAYIDEMKDIIKRRRVLEYDIDKAQQLWENTNKIVREK